MAMTVRVSEFDVADAIRRGDLSLGIVLTSLAMHPGDDHDTMARAAGGWVGAHGNPDATRALLRDILTHSERSVRAAG